MERLTLRQRELMQALLLAWELGDAAALSRLLIDIGPDDEGMLWDFQRLNRVDRGGVRVLIAGLAHDDSGLPAGGEGHAPGFRIPVGQVLVKSRVRSATTMDGHGDKSRRKQALA